MRLEKFSNAIRALPDNRVTGNQFFLIESNYSITIRIITMKNKILALGCMAALLAFSSDAYAAAEGTATATIGNSVSVAKTATGSSTGGDLAFGYVIPSTTTAGSVTIDPDGTPHYTTVTGTSTLPRGAARFEVTGVAGLTYSVTVSGSTTITNGTETMTVNNFTKSALPEVGLDGKAIFTVGGKLTVAASQANGSYTGTFDVSATYN